MSKIFENDSDTEADIKTDNEYAKNYDNWRKKEELNKLKTKYGEEVLDEESSSSSDDEEGVKLTEAVEKSFFKTLSYIKNKDPRIYDEKVQFFDDDTSKVHNSHKKKKEKPMYIGDYERELILNKNAEVSDSDNEPRAMSPTYVEEQKKIKENLKKVLDNVKDDDSADEWGGMLKVRSKSQKEKEKEEAEYKDWLVGQKDQLADKDAEKDLKPLKEYWNNPNLDDGEKFLRDYILQKRFLSREDEDYIPTYEEIIHDSDKDLSEDEEAIEKQEQFEHKYNFRYEEPDPEFVKRYPRTIEQSLRKTDDKRKLKRAETKERKQKEKEQKMQEIKKLQQFKRQEIEEKIEKLKEITGNTDLEFKGEDLESDFDPEAHDKRMQSLFNEDFYEGPEEEQKPVFPDIDEYLQLENWEKWDGTEKNDQDDPHCEDEDFNMDADYDPQASTQQELIHSSRGKKKRKRKSLFAKALSEPKPIFDPNDKTYEQYLDEYYKLDCEDIIGDIPCRFKYRKVIPNSFGLTIEEILTAKDRELNKWCSLKKAVQHRPDHVEKYDQIAFDKKSQNVDLKRRILPSLFEPEENVKLIQKTPQDEKQKKNKNFVDEVPTTVNDKKQKKKKMNKITSTVNNPTLINDKTNKDNVLVVNKSNATEEEVEKIQTTIKDKKRKKKKPKTSLPSDGNAREATVDEIDKPEQKIKQKKLKKQKNINVLHQVINENDNNPSNQKKRKKKNAVQLNPTNQPEAKVAQKRKLSDAAGPKKKRKKFNPAKLQLGISDARLSAYGINPKKFKNKMKYKKD